jgi:WD40 repeat protein/anti-sigma factor RsiW
MAKHYHDLLPFYLNGRLPTAELIALEQHLLSCQECRAALDEWRALADAVSTEAVSRAADLPPLSPQLYRAQQEPATTMPSTSSRRNSFLRKWNIEESVTIRRPSAKDEEDKDMNTTYDVSLEPARPLQFPDARRLIFEPITWVAAILAMILLGAALVFMRASFNPGAGGAPEEAVPEFAAQPQPCVSTGQDPQAESVRLAGEASSLLADASDNTELATLLSVCALQTAYTPEADEALQLSLFTANGLPEFPGNDTGVLNSALFSPDGRYLLVSRGDGAQLWDVESATEIRSFLPAWGGPIAFSPDGRYVLGTFQFNLAYLWDTETGALVQDFNAGSEIVDLTFSPDGTRIAVALITGTVQIWRVDTATQERRVPLGYDISDVAFSPDGQTLLVSGDRNRPYSLHLLDVKTGTELRIFTGLRDFANMAVFSPDGRYILAGGDTADRRALLWDAETGEELATFSGYINDINTVSFSADSRYALVGSADGTVGLWDIESETEVRRFVGDPGYVWSVGFSPDGNTILIGSSTGVVRLVPTDYHNMIALACEHLTRDFTYEEREQYDLGAGPACQ